MKEQLKIVNNLKIHEDTLNWSIFGIFLAANVLLVIETLKNNDLPAKWIFPILGFSLSIIWFYIQKRALEFLVFYEKIIEGLEDELKIPEGFQTTKNNKILFPKNIEGLTVREIMISITDIWIIVWLISFFLTL